MTIAELEHNLPNGFHDSFMVGFAVDFAAATACFELDVDFDNPNPDVFKRIKLRVSGLSLFVVGQPDMRNPLSFGSTVWTSGYETDEKMLPDLETYRRNAPAGSFFYSFFLKHYNCFIHLSATDASLAPLPWTSEP